MKKDQSMPPPLPGITRPTKIGESIEQTYEEWMEEAKKRMEEKKGNELKNPAQISQPIQQPQPTQQRQPTQNFQDAALAAGAGVIPVRIAGSAAPGTSPGTPNTTGPIVVDINNCNDCNIL